MLSFRRGKFTPFILLVLLLIAVSSILLSPKRRYQLQNTFSYATRPIWDHRGGPRTILPHFYYEGMPIDDSACAAHGWSRRQEEHSVVVLDAILMSSEIDLLEIRLAELDPVVDRFFIVESNATFTGLLKETYFANNRERFKDYEHKIEYHFIPGRSLDSTSELPSAWSVEAQTRDFMTTHLQTYISTHIHSSSSSDALVIMSDLDEIPSRHTISLLRACAFGRSIHLILRNYLYSFEWYLGPLSVSWRASVQLFSPPHGEGEGEEVVYRHSKISDVALADAGWHCSFCFRTLPEYVVKMRGYSHADRIGGDEELLDLERIQERICNGEDIFGMLPEAYSYGDLLSQIYLEPTRSAVYLPQHVIKNVDQFRFLLPGGCMREHSGLGEDGSYSSSL